MKRLPQLIIQPDTGDDLEWHVAQQRDFTGGETQALLPELVGRDQFLRMENAMLFIDGTVTSSFQLDHLLIQGATTGLALVQQSNTTYTYYWANGAGSVLTGDIDSSSSTPINVTGGTPHSIANAYIKGIQKGVYFLGKYYVPNPNPDNTKNGILNLTDYATVTISGKTTHKLRVYTNRLWAINTEGTIQCSNNGDASTWDALNILWLPNREPAIDFIPIQNGAIVYSKSTVYAMYGSSYLDIQFVPIATDLQLSSGAVKVDNTIYIVSSEGVVACSLNSVQTLPHKQDLYFKENFAVFSKDAYATETVVGIHLERFKAIYFTWAATHGGTKSFIYYLERGSFSKITQLLPNDYPYILALNDANTDFIIGTSDGSIVKSAYPSSVLDTARTAYLQTRHEDAGTAQSKVWRELSITLSPTSAALNDVKIEAYLDYSTTPVLIAEGYSLYPRENKIFLDIPRSVYVSFLITISNTLLYTLSSDDSIYTLTDDLGLDILTGGQFPANFILQALKVKYRTAGQFS